MKNLITYMKEILGSESIGTEIRLDPNGINGEYFDDNDDMPSIGRVYTIIKVNSDKEGNPLSIDIKEEGTGKVFEGYGIPNFILNNNELNRGLDRYLAQK